MKKLIILLLLFIGFKASAQNTVTLPSGTVSYTPAFRYGGSLTDSLKTFWFGVPGGGYNQWYSGTYINKYFLRISAFQDSLANKALYFSTNFKGFGSTASPLDLADSIFKNNWVFKSTDTSNPALTLISNNNPGYTLLIKDPSGNIKGGIGTQSGFFGPGMHTLHGEQYGALNFTADSGSTIYYNNFLSGGYFLKLASSAHTYFTGDTTGIHASAYVDTAHMTAHPNDYVTAKWVLAHGGGGGTTTNPLTNDWGIKTFSFNGGTAGIKVGADTSSGKLATQYYASTIVGPDGVVTGMSPVTVSGTTATVPSGTYRLNNALITKGSSTNVTIDPQDATSDRIDLIVGDASGVLSKVSGSLAATPAQPDVPSNKALISWVYIPATGGTVTTGGGGSTKGTVTTVKGVNANGFTFSISNPTTTPTITLSQQNATTSQSGQLTSTDWNTFNNKQAAGNYITALTGDATASGPGSAALTLATVNSNVGSFGDASHSLSVTANAKGLITGVSTNSIQIAESQVTSLTTDLAAKVAISAPQLTTSSTSGYVWTATDALGHGSWQAVSGGGTTTNPLTNGNGIVAFTFDGSAAKTVAVDQTYGFNWTGLNIFGQTLTLSSGTNYGTEFLHNVTLSGTAGFTDVLINRTSSGSGSGSQRLLDLQLNGTSVANFNTSGGLTLSSSVTSNGNFTANQYSTSGTYSNDGLYLYNSAVAASGTPSLNSLRTRFMASVWNTTATAAPNYAFMYNELRTVSGATPAYSLYWAGNLSTTSTMGTPTDIMSLGNTGNLWLSGKASVGTTSTSSILNVGAGSTSTAPLTIAAGTNLTTPTSGAIENDGSNLYYTNSSNQRYALLTATANTPQIISIANVGNSTTTNGLTLTNPTAATSSQLQYSPVATLSGYGWNGSSSQQVQSFWQLQTQSNTNPASANLVGWFSQNGTATGSWIQVNSASRAVSFGGTISASEIDAVAFSSTGNNTSAVFVYNRSFTTANAALKLLLGTGASNSSGLFLGAQFTPTINQSGSAGYKGIYESVYEQATGSGVRYLMDLGTNSAQDNGGTHTSKATIDDLGNLQTASSIGSSEITYANRPPSPYTGQTCNFSDSTVNTWGATVSGSGTNHVLARWNGANWTVIGI
jgi:hypothetical protein